MLDDTGFPLLVPWFIPPFPILTKQSLPSCIVGNFESEFKLQIKSSHNGCHKYSYYDLVDYAFKSGLLDDETKNIGLYQREIVDWIVNNVDGYSETVKKQNLNQGVYMTLSKFYLKLSQEDGRNRWLPRKRLADSETTDGAMDDEEDE